MTPTHREFKVLLRGDRFSERSALHAIGDLLARTAHAQAVPFDRAPMLESRVRTVEFFDTADHALRASHRILRRRQGHDQGWPDPTCEVTYKVRSEDRGRCASVALAPVTGLSGGPRTRVQLKEEILPGADAGTTRSLWSHNVVLDTPPVRLPAAVGTVAAALPDLAELRLAPPTPLIRVGDRHVVEVGAMLGSLHVGRHTVAHGDVALWRLGGDASAFIAEAGFTYHVTGEPDDHRHAHERADALFLALVHALDAWRTDVPTKTQALYDLATADAGRRVPAGVTA